MKEHVISVKNLATRSKLPASDFVINPYVGCPHGCKYCYARFMKRFSKHAEEWGNFIDIKIAEKPLNPKLLYHKTVFMASVTDCYNPYEKEYCVTRNVLRELLEVDCNLHIATKSSLILRDLDLLSKFRQLKVAISINTLDERFRADMDNASSIAERLATLAALYRAGIHTVLFMSPIFPELTNYREIIEATTDFVDEYWFEDLNLRGDYKRTILEYIYENYRDVYPLFDSIYNHGDRQYWGRLESEITEYCIAHNLHYSLFFNHNALVQIKKQD